MAVTTKTDNIEEFSIYLDDFEDNVVAGSCISGYVLVNCRKPIDIKNISVELSGKAYCCWMEGESENYIGKENILKTRKCLCGSLSECHTFKFPTGEQKYAFSFQLPEPLPSSFEDTFGYIRYSLKASIQKSWKIKHKVKLPITVRDKIDTNLPFYKEGEGGEKHKKVGLFCHRAAPINMSANIDRSCYCPGEKIFINSEVTNHTSRDTKLMSAKLIQTVTYNASGKQKKTNKVVATIKGPKIKNGSKETWDNEPFDVPHISPSINNCRIISVQYKLIVKVPVRFSSDPSVRLDVVIGTIPFEPEQSFSSGAGPLSEPPRYHEVVNNADLQQILHSPDGTNAEEVPPRYSSLFGVISQAETPIC